MAGASVLKGREVLGLQKPIRVWGGERQTWAPRQVPQPKPGLGASGTLRPYSPGPSAFQGASSSSSSYAVGHPWLFPSLFHPRPLPGASPIKAATAKINTAPTKSRQSPWGCRPCPLAHCGARSQPSPQRRWPRRTWLFLGRVQVLPQKHSSVWQPRTVRDPPAQKRPCLTPQRILGHAHAHKHISAHWHSGTG